MGSKLETSIEAGLAEQCAALLAGADWLGLAERLERFDRKVLEPYLLWLGCLKT